MKLTPDADAIAFALEPRFSDGMTFDAIRDYCDIASGGDLAPRTLDRLAYMVAWRLEYRPAKWLNKRAAA